MPQVIQNDDQVSDDPGASIDALLKQYRQKQKQTTADPADGGDDVGAGALPAVKPAPAVPPVPPKPQPVPAPPKPVSVSKPTPPPAPKPPVPLPPPPKPAAPLPAPKSKAPPSSPAPQRPAQHSPQGNARTSKPALPAPAEQKERILGFAGPEKSGDDIKGEIKELERQLNERKEAMEREANMGKAIERGVEIEKVPEETEQKESAPKESPALPADKPDKPSGKVVADLPAGRKSNLQAILKLSVEDQVKVLTKMVHKDGLYKAINVAKRMGNPYVLDLLHDTLVDELFVKLKGPKTK